MIRRILRFIGITRVPDMEALILVQAARIAELEAAIKRQAGAAKTLREANAMLTEEMDRLIAEAKTARNNALREAADKLHQRFYPKNEESDWTEFAKIHAAVAIEASSVTRALIEGEPT